MIPARGVVDAMIVRLLTLLTALALCLGTAGSAHAYVRESSNWNPGSLPVGYYINQATIPSSLGTSGGIGAVEGGFATWASPTCTSWRASDLGNTTTMANTGDRRNVILWLTSWPAELGSVGSVIGVTTPVWTSGGYFIDADIQFNDQGFNWNTTGAGGGSYVDAQSIATHEEGHFLGLDHTPVGSAIMYASYSGGLKRTLASDDQSGVCTIYPSGVAASDSGVTPVDAGTSSSDPCSMLGNTCAGCTPYDGCGFCGATSQCVSGTQTGPISGSCASGYVWFSRDCGSSMVGTDGGTSGTGRFGDPCTQPTDCGSGGLCAVDSSTGAGFCTRACSDDCTCPDAYRCYAVSTTISICIPGTRTCSAPGNDAGTITPGDDAAVIPGDDAGTLTPGDDAAAVMADDGGPTGTPRGTRAGGCGCSTAGASHGGLGGSALVLAALGLITARRRRRATR